MEPAVLTSASTARHYCYVVVNPNDETATPLHFAPSRRAAREWIEWQQDADALRVRRAALKIFES